MLIKELNLTPSVLLKPFSVLTTKLGNREFHPDLLWDILGVNVLTQDCEIKTSKLCLEKKVTEQPFFHPNFTPLTDLEPGYKLSKFISSKDSTQGPR